MSSAFIDLYSDTKTKPTAAMRKAMAEAEVGDEQKFEDPTTNRLRERVCALLGTEDAVFLPSGTMCNQIALRVHCRPGEEVICDRTAHIVNSEGGGPAAHAGVMIHSLDGRAGIFDGTMVDEVVHDPTSRYSPRTRLVVIEQTANLGGGTVWPLATIQEVAAAARRHGLSLHMDGARLPNAWVQSNVTPAAFAAPFDSLWIDFSKGLGAPVGGMLAGSRDFIRDAWRFKQMMGGAMRQSGILAAAALHALDHHVDRLREDHDNARRLAEGLAAIPGIALDLARVQTNIVYFDVVKEGWTAAKLVAACKAEGVGMGAFGPRTIRVVTHLDVNRAAIDTAIGVVARMLAQKPQ
jgi:threonine aldolase